MESTSPRPEGEQERLRRNYFYRYGTPEDAREMFEQFLAELPTLQQDEEKRELLSNELLYFTRAAQGRPEVLRAFEALAEGLPASRLPVVVRLLMHAGDATTLVFLRRLAQRPDVLTAAPGLADSLAGGIGPDPKLEAMWASPVEHPAQLDLRWSDFMASGDRRKVSEIFAVLAWPEQLRVALQPKLAPVRGLLVKLTGGEGKRRQTMAALEPLGIRVDAGSGEILNREDLDIFAIATDLNFDEQRFEVIRGLQVLTPALALALAIKTSAIWSLALNGVEHPAVLEVCEAEAAKLTGTPRLSALELLLTIHRRRGDAKAALAVITAYLAANPKREDLQAEAAELRVAAAFAALREALAGAGRRTELDEAAGARAAGRCAEELAHAPGHHVRATYTLHAAPDTGTRMTRSVWRAQAAGGDRIRVWRAFWTREDDGLADEWLAVGGVNYMHGPGMWLRPPPDFNPRTAENRLMRADWLTPLLRRAPDSSAAVLRSRAWVELVYAADLGDLFALLGVPRGAVEVTLTIDAETYWPARAVVRAGPAMAEAERFEWEVLLVAPAEPVRIEVPARVLDMTHATRVR